MPEMPRAAADMDALLSRMPWIPGMMGDEPAQHGGRPLGQGLYGLDPVDVGAALPLDQHAVLLDVDAHRERAQAPGFRVQAVAAEAVHLGQADQLLRVVVAE